MRDDLALLQGMSLIHWAAVLGHADLVELLLSNGATVSAKNTKVRFATLNVQCGAHVACNKNISTCGSSSCVMLSKTASLLECMACPWERPNDTIWLLRICC